MGKVRKPGLELEISEVQLHYWRQHLFIYFFYWLTTEKECLHSFLNLKLDKKKITHKKAL